MTHMACLHLAAFVVLCAGDPSCDRAGGTCATKGSSLLQRHTALVTPRLDAEPETLHVTCVMQREPGDDSTDGLKYGLCESDDTDERYYLRDVADGPVEMIPPGATVDLRLVAVQEDSPDENTPWGNDDAPLYEVLEFKVDADDLGFDEGADDESLLELDGAELTVVDSSERADRALLTSRTAARGATEGGDEFCAKDDDSRRRRRYHACSWYASYKGGKYCKAAAKPSRRRTSAGIAADTCATTCGTLMGCVPNPEWTTTTTTTTTLADSANYHAPDGSTCPDGTENIQDPDQCRAAAGELGRRMGYVGTWQGAPTGCRMGCGSKVYFNRYAGNIWGKVICSKIKAATTAPPTTTTENIAPMAVRKVAEICPAQLYTESVLCDDGSILEVGKCCPDNNFCPSSCMGPNSMSGNGAAASCSCQKCPKQRKLQLSDQEAFLKAHNYLRCLHGYGELEWNSVVATNAGIPAGQSCDAGELVHSKSYDMTPSAGENLAKGQRSPEHATVDWYNEVVEPGYTAGTSGTDASGAGHYTALIWKASTKLGCTSCGVGSNKVWACQYAESPPNFGGQAEWLANVPQGDLLAVDPAACCARIYGN